MAFTKGAVEPLLDICARAWSGTRTRPLDAQRRGEILASQDRLAADGMRILGVAFRPFGDVPPADAAERDLVFVGMVGRIDPPRRAEVREAVRTCASAGVKPVMITGDHPLTAAYIARQLGIPLADRIVTGREVKRLSAEALAAIVDETTVYARVSPQHKYRIVEALQARGHVVAMTGDGVNDAPALKRADIGVAMGVTGTDVAKDAADAVLMDDDFATIVAAVEEGRVIYDDVRKFVKYLVTDGPTALSLALEPAERGIMRRPPRPPRESIFAGGLDATWCG